MNILDNNNQNNQPQIDPNKNYLEELVGEGKKFKTQEELARGKAEADLYIEHMKARHDELRQDYQKLYEQHNAGPSLKETLDQYMAELKQSQGQTIQPLGQQEDKSAPLDEAKLAELVKSHIQANKQLDREESNAKTVESRLQEVYGPNYKQLVSQQINQLGISADFFNNLARTSPQAVYNTLQLDAQKETFQSPPTSTQRTDPFNKAKRTEAYYEKLRKEKPLEYRNPKTQDQMFKDINEQGESFFDLRDIRLIY